MNDTIRIVLAILGGLAFLLAGYFIVKADKEDPNNKQGKKIC